MRLALALIVATGIAGAGAACSRASEESEAKRTPIALPSDEAAPVPAGLHIAVTVGGADAPAITADVLTRAKPDFEDARRRAWKLTSLVPAFAQDGAVLEARGRGGVALELDRPASAAAPQPVLFLTRRGDVTVTLVDPANPFPDYHGQGGRLKRRGDPAPRLDAVTTLAVKPRS